MGVDKKAEIEIDVKGADKAAAAARGALQPWTQFANQAKQGISAFGSEAKKALGGVASELTTVLTVGSSISFAGAVQSVQSLEAATSKLSVAMKSDFSSAKREIADLSQKLGTSPDQVAAYINTVGKSTYNFAGAKRDMEAFNKFAKETGRELGETGPLSNAFGRLGIDDADKALRQLRGTAESFKTVGGPAALADQFAALAPAFSKASNDASKLIALTAQLGKGLPAAQAAEVQQAVVGSFAGNERGYDAHFRAQGGKTLFDANGKFDLARAMKLRQAELRRMNQTTAAAIGAGEFGSPMAFAAFMKMDFDAQSTEKDSDAAQRYASTPGGVQAANKAALDRNMQNDIGADSWVGRQRAKISGFASNNPLSAKALELSGLVAGKMGANALMKGGGWKALKGAARGGGALSHADAAFSDVFGVGTLAADIQLQGLLNLKKDPEEYRNEAGLYGAGIEQYHPQQLKQARDLVTAYERGGSGSGFVQAAGAPLLAQSEGVPALSSLAQQLYGGKSELSGLPADIKAAVKEAIAEGKLGLVIKDETVGGIDVSDQPGGQQ
jgi:hypothetical protein